MLRGRKVIKFWKREEESLVRMLTRILTLFRIHRWKIRDLRWTTM